MRIEELVGSLQTYEHTLPMDKKNKSIALKAIREESGESSDELAMSDKKIAFYAKKFRKMFAQKNPRQEKRRFKGINGGSSSENREGRYKRETRAVNDNIQCHECHGFGHIRLECANYKKAKEKANAASLTESESESSDSQESSPRKKNFNYMAFTSSVAGKSHNSESVVEIESVSENESGDEDDLQEIYEKLYKECVKLRKLNKEHIEEIDLCKRENEGLQGKLREAIGLTDELQKRNVTLEDKVTTHENELTLLNTKLQKFSIGTNQLDKILSLGKSSSDKSGLGYFEENPDAPSSSKAFGKNVRTTVFVPEMTEKRKAHPSEKGKKPVQVQKSVPPPKRQGARNMSPICHHCGKLGHIRPNCFKLMSHFVHASAFVNSRTAYPSGRGKNYMNDSKNVSTFLRQRAHKASPPLEGFKFARANAWYKNPAPLEPLEHSGLFLPPVRFSSSFSQISSFKQVFFFRNHLQTKVNPFLSCIFVI
ncbi:hypothetical protein I3842_15G088300 [Carya illinoinensis]|uniref:CCHC-type domain-containing protein n=1 Tax=Carya illinoinensis TaxID=32201 RepID=A0A922AA65_CARIL|nr:hypothetical protein I3842_15G088300 [Carya illinoinensis]